MSAPLDLVGLHFGRLTVTERLPAAQTPDGKRVKNPRIWRCQCECGTIKDFTTGELRSGRVSSCGCLRTEFLRKLQSQPVKSKLGMQNQTNESRISSNKPSRNNKLGLRGVSETPHETYVAFIYFKKNAYLLGYI